MIHTGYVLMSKRFHIPPLLVAFVVAVGLHVALVPVSLEAFGRSGRDVMRVDLSVATVQAPAEPRSGDVVRVQVVVENLGSADAPLRQDRLVLSRDRAVDSADFELARRQATPLRSGELERFKLVGMVPADADGPFVLIVEADAPAGEQRRPTDDAEPGNNTRGTSVFIDGPQAPELSVDRFDAPANGIIGSTLLVDFAVRNIGPGWARGGWRDRVYLSTDARLDAGDLALRALRRDRHLGPDSAYGYERLELRIPATPPGRYYLFAVADDGQVLDQPSFTAGLAVAPIELTVSDKPDLVVTQIQTAQRVVVGEPTPMSFSIANFGVEGTGPGEAWMDGVYLSRDKHINPDEDIFLGSADSLARLPAGERYTHPEHHFTLPEGIEPGAWYLAVVTDAGEAVDEGAFESNNAWAVPIRVLSREQAEQDIPLGDPEEIERLTVAWIEHEVLDEHMARLRDTIQPAIQSRVEPDPDAPSNPDPLPPSQASIAQQQSGDPNRPRREVDQQEQASPRPLPSVPDAQETDVAPRPQDPTAPSPPQIDGLDGETGQTPRRQEGVDTDRPTPDPNDPEPLPDEQDLNRPRPGERTVDSDADRQSPDTDRQTDSDTPADRATETDQTNPEPTDSDTPSETTPETNSDTATDNDTTDPSEREGEGDSEQADEQADTAREESEQDAPAPPGQQNPAGAPPSEEQETTRREREDGEADPTDIDEPLRFQEGGVLVGRGIRITTQRLRTPGAGTRFASVPRDAAVRLVFNNQGQVVDAEVTRSTGYADWDALILESLYKWSASGERVESAQPYVEISMPYRFGILSGLRR